MKVKLWWGAVGEFRMIERKQKDMVLQGSAGS